MLNRNSMLETEENEWDDQDYSSVDTFPDDSKNFQYDLCKYMRPPNPLIEKGLYIQNEVKTAFKLNFLKLPSFVIGNDNIQDNDERSKFSQRLFKEDILNDNPIVSPIIESDPMPSFKNGKTLFSLYPENDPRQIYQKYKKEQNFDIGQRVYASLFINLNHILKSGKALKIQYGNATSLNDIENIIPIYDGNGDNDHTLCFTSNFESGNLFAVFKISNNEYDLILQNDINSKGNTQWFFYSISNTIKDSIVKFNIVNMMKPASLFNNGMQPAVLSTIENKQNGVSWQREGFNISYYKNYIMKENLKAGNMNQPYYYTLTFSYKFKYDKDTVYFAQCYPYTYSDLNTYLYKICTDSYQKHLINRKVLCKTLAQNDCEYLTITSNRNVENMDDRYGVFFSARQHPGESLSSYMMQGIIDFLTSRNEEADYLRRNCIFKIIPMLNPDGVIHGNYRTSLSGSDLNRRWKKTTKMLYPTVYHTKVLLRKFKRERNIKLILDLHGHSRKTNSFIYGCTDPSNPIDSRIFPYLLSKISSSFSFQDSRFTIHKSKESTARVALWREFKIPNVFTLEASFYGYEKEGKHYHYTRQNYINIGRDICKAFYAYFTQVIMKITNLPQELSSIQPKHNNSIQEINNNKQHQQHRDKLTVDVNRLIQELQTNNELVELGEKQDDSGSDSNPSEDELPVEDMSKLCSKPKLSLKKGDKLRSSFNMSNKKIEKANIGTNTMISDDIKKLKVTKSIMIEKIPFKTKGSKKITPPPPASSSTSSIIPQMINESGPAIVVEMVDKETQTDEVFLENQDICTANEANFISELQQIPSKKDTINGSISELNSRDNEIKKYFDVSYGILPSKAKSMMNPSQIFTQKSYNPDNKNGNNSNASKGNANKQGTPAKNREEKKNILNDFAYKLAPKIHGKTKSKKNSTDGDLWIKGKKCEENSKLCELDVLNIQQILKSGEKNLNISEHSFTIYKNMTTPTIPTLLRNGSMNQNMPRPITANENKVEGEVSPKNSSFVKNKDNSFINIQTSLMSRSPRFQNIKNFKIIEKGSITKRRGLNTAFNAPQSFRNTTKHKQQSMPHSRRSGLDSSNGNNLHSQSGVFQPNTTGSELFNKFGVVVQKNNNNIDDSIEFKSSKFFTMLNGLNVYKHLTSHKNDAEQIQNIIKLKDLTKNTKEKIFSQPINDGINGLFKKKITRGDIKSNDFGSTQTRMVIKKFQKDDKKLWGNGLYRS